MGTWAADASTPRRRVSSNIWLHDHPGTRRQGARSANAHVASTDAATGKSVVESIGPCETVNCGRGWAQSQFNLRISKAFPVGRASVEVIGEVFNLFNAINPSNIVGGVSANRNVVTASGEPDPSLLQPASYSGDSQRPEQRVGQIGIRLSF